MRRAGLLEHHPEMAQRQGRLQVRPLLLAGMPEKGKTGDRANVRACSVTLINRALLARFLGQNPLAGYIPRWGDFQPIPGQAAARIFIGITSAPAAVPMEPAESACYAE